MASSALGTNNAATKLNQSPVVPVAPSIGTSNPATTAANMLNGSNGSPADPRVTTESTVQGTTPHTSQPLMSTARAIVSNDTVGSDYQPLHIEEGHDQGKHEEQRHTREVNEPFPFG